MARLATLITRKRGLFIPLPEHFMTDPKDASKPGAFLQLFPHPLSRLFMTLLWRINKEQDGDAVVLTNKWLMEFAKLDAKSLTKYRKHLHGHNVIHSKALDKGHREYLYRIVDRKGLPLEEHEGNAEAVERLKDVETKKQAVKTRVIRRFRGKSPAASTATTTTAEAAEMPSSWGTHGDILG